MHANQAFTEEQRAELHAVEAQIRRRIAIGSTVSERKLKVGVKGLLRFGNPLLQPLPLDVPVSGTAVSSLGLAQSFQGLAEEPAPLPAFTT